MIRNYQPRGARFHLLTAGGVRERAARTVLDGSGIGFDIYYLSPDMLCLLGQDGLMLADTKTEQTYVGITCIRRAAMKYGDD